LSANQIEAFKRETENFSGAPDGARQFDSVSGMQRGFTLTELITIIVILGIISAVAVPRFFDRNVFESRGFYDQVISTLRYAQKAAIAQHRFVCVAITTVQTITLTQGSTAACGGALGSPTGEASFTVSSDNVSITAPAVGDFISFDCLGRPRTVGNVAASCAPGNVVGVLAVNSTLQVQDAPAITIEAETGYVH
jgi:MSHA pilin protein MshC